MKFPNEDFADDPCDNAGYVTVAGYRSETLEKSKVPNFAERRMLSAALNGIPIVSHQQEVAQTDFGYSAPLTLFLHDPEEVNYMAFAPAADVHPAEEISHYLSVAPEFDLRPPRMDETVDSQSSNGSEVFGFSVTE